MNVIATDIKKGRKFDQVLEGARDIFMRDGFEGASVDDIAKAAEVSKATLYSYFSDKRLLFTEVCRVECNRQAEELMQEVDLNTPVEKVVHDIAFGVVSFFLTDFGKQMYRTFVSESGRFPELGKTFYETGAGMLREKLSLVFGAYVARGDLKIDDLNMAASQFASLCKGDIFVRSMCGLQKEFTEAEIEYAVNSVTEMFMARYKA